MIKIVVILVVIAFVVGVLSYKDDKLVVDTKKASEVMDKSKTFVKENVEVN